MAKQNLNDSDRGVMMSECSAHRDSVYKLLWRILAVGFTALGVILTFFWLSTSSMSAEMVKIKIANASIQQKIENTKNEILLEIRKAK